MKKVLFVLMVVAAMMFATNANAQIKFGLKGGLDVTNMSLSNDVFDASNKTGFFVGPMVKVTIPIVGLRWPRRSPPSSGSTRPPPGRRTPPRRYSGAPDAGRCRR